MVEFETMSSAEIKFGNNKFLEVARKKAKGESGETEIISISKGFIGYDGQKRFKKSLGFPADKNIIEELAEKIKTI
ncbi:MAG: hypothetical protein HY362_00075 [Candidatus Aenigmarchaeota archaeon]|nr:hypothetical protein [Candidatus Aenigmarchaeota archaeon]